jgi:hypothetical protein
MKKLTYLIAILATVFVVGCGNINTTVPEVKSPDAKFQFLKIYDDATQRLNTTEPESFSATIDPKNPNRLVIRNSFQTNAKSFMIGIASTTDLGSNINITYTDASATGTTPAVNDMSINYEHHFDITQKGRGTGKSFNVVLKYDYPNVAMGSRPTVLKKIQL